MKHISCLFGILLLLFASLGFMGGSGKSPSSFNNLFLKLSCADETDSLKMDSCVLVELYNSLGGENWIDNNWMQGGEISSWYGIDVENGRVTKIILDTVTTLSGELPLSIGLLIELKELRLGKNDSLTIIPPEIGNLINLTNLKLVGNIIKSIPPEIGKLENLIELDVRTDKTLETISDSIYNLSKLEILRLKDGKLNTISPKIKNLTSLTELDLTNNQLTELPNELDSLINLKKLWLAQNINLQYFPNIASIETLEILSLRQCGISNIPTYIGNFTSLKTLDISHNNLTLLPNNIWQLTNLTTLALSHNQITFISKEIGALTELNCLILGYNQLISLPTEIGNLNKLRALYLPANQLTSLPAEIETLNALDTLNLAINQLTFSSIEPIFQQGLELYIYSPQAKIGTTKTDTLKLGDTTYQVVISAGGTVTKYQWYKDGKLLDGKVDSILNIESPIFDKAGTYTCKASNDIAPNLILESEPQYLVLPAVTKIINQDGGDDYLSIEAAIDDLVAGNIDSIGNSNQTPMADRSIIFNIAPDSGPYNEQIVIPSIEETSPTFTININGNGNTLTFDGTDCEQPAIIQIDGADYVVIANLNIEVDETATGGWAIHLKNEADNVQIVNCSIQANSTATTPCFAGIVASNSDNDYLNNEVALGLNANNTIIEGCDFIGGYAAIAMIGSEDTLMFGPTILGNIISDAYSVGILSTFSNGIIIDNNQIDMTNYDTNGADNITNIIVKCAVGKSQAYAKKKEIDLEEAKQGRAIYIQNNQLKGTQYRGISLVDSYRVGNWINNKTNEVQPPLSLIANNTVEGILAINDMSSISAGMYLDKVKKINCYHNSIEIDGIENQFGTALFIKESDNLTILNNSLAYTGNNGYSIYVEDNSSLVWDYNNYYKGDSPTLAHYNGENYLTLEEIPNNPNSISTEPQFIFTFNDDSELLDTASIGVASLVPFDFEGDVRPDPITLKPDIGANEFVIGVFDNTFNQVVDAPMIEYTTANQWQHIFKNDSIAVSINSNVNLGEITTNLYIDSVGVRKFYGKYCLDRNFRLKAKSDFAATAMVQIRLYITQRELDRLMEVDDKINAFKDLNLTYLNKELEGDMGVFSVDGGETKFFTQENSQQISTDAYLLEYRLTGITQLGEFWLHGGDEALVVGIEDVVPTFEGLSIYPNPFDERFTLELDSPVSAQTDVVVRDIQGKVVYRYAFEAVLGEKRYELAFPSDLGSGVYLVEVRQGEKRGVLKVVAK